MTALLLMYIFDISINIISLGGLAVAIGMLVDNSIIVLENTNRHRTELSRSERIRRYRRTRGCPPHHRIDTDDYCGFLPLIFMDGLGGRLFRDQSLAITFSLLASLLVAVSLVPMLVSRRRKRSRRYQNIQSSTPRDSSPGSHDTYEIALVGALRHRFIVMTATLLLLGGAVITAIWMPKEFMPPVQQGHFVAEIELEAGTTIEQTAAHISDIERSVAQLNTVAAVFSSIGEPDELLLTGPGNDGVHSNRRAELDVRLRNPGAQPAVESFIREIASQRYGVQVAFRQPESMFEQIIRPAEWDITIAVEADAAVDIERALEASALIKRAVAEIPGIVDVRPGYELSAPEYRLIIDRERLAAYALTVTDLVTTITQQVRASRQRR
jgi:hydrophobic/amphiphilic exporter-1 (mainly G- bacteria), HAE1 family